MSGCWIKIDMNEAYTKFYDAVLALFLVVCEELKIIAFVEWLDERIGTN